MFGQITSCDFTLQSEHLQQGNPEGKYILCVEFYSENITILQPASNVAHLRSAKDISYSQVGHLKGEIKVFENLKKSKRSEIPHTNLKLCLL